MQRIKIISGLIFLAAVPVLGQVQTKPAPTPPAGYVANSDNQAQMQAESTQDQSDDRMLTPPVVSGQSYPTTLVSQERGNYLRGGMTFSTGYGENNIASVNGHAINQMNSSIAPNIALDKTTSRLHLLLTYAPGFTFYQRTSSLNETDQSGSIDLEYRLSPHVVFAARDALEKTSSILSQPDFTSTQAVSAGAQQPNFSVISPIADLLRNSGYVGVSYQFSLNGMMGASGTFSNLYYPNPTQVPGLYDSSSQGGSAFYARRLSRKQYAGAIYQYQRLIANPTAGLSESQTQAVLAYYTWYATSHLSVSLFGGPQYSDTIRPPLASHLLLPAATAWNPAAGGSVNWQGRLTGLAVSYSHIIAGGSGLIGAVHMDSAGLTFRQQITRNLSAYLAGGYAQNDVVGSPLAAGLNGHTVIGTASLQRTLRQFLNIQAGYTRVHQDYSNVAAISSVPDMNREFISVSYQFSRPFGR